MEIITGKWITCSKCDRHTRVKMAMPVRVRVLVQINNSNAPLTVLVSEGPDMLILAAAFRYTYEYSSGSTCRVRVRILVHYHCPHTYQYKYRTVTGHDDQLGVDILAPKSSGILPCNNHIASLAYLLYSYCTRTSSIWLNAAIVIVRVRVPTMPVHKLEPTPPG